MDDELRKVLDKAHAIIEVACKVGDNPIITGAALGHAVGAVIAGLMSRSLNSGGRWPEHDFLLVFCAAANQSMKDHGIPITLTWKNDVSRS